MWILLVRAAITGVFGSAFGKWFLSTRMGRWFQTKLDNFMEYLAKKYDINIAKKEIAWAQAYPNLANRIEKLENWSHPPIVPGGATELMEEIAKLQKQIDGMVRESVIDTVKKKPDTKGGTKYSSKRKAK
jgi:hypothetical protein